MSPVDTIQQAMRRLEEAHFAEHGTGSDWLDGRARGNVDALRETGSWLLREAEADGWFVRYGPVTDESIQWCGWATRLAERYAQQVGEVVG